MTTITIHLDDFPGEVPSIMEGINYVLKVHSATESDIKRYPYVDSAAVDAAMQAVVAGPVKPTLPQEVGSVISWRSAFDDRDLYARRVSTAWESSALKMPKSDEALLKYLEGREFTVLTPRA